MRSGDGSRLGKSVAFQIGLEGDNISFLDDNLVLSVEAAEIEAQEALFRLLVNLQDVFAPLFNLSLTEGVQAQGRFFVLVAEQSDWSAGVTNKLANVTTTQTASTVSELARTARILSSRG